MSTLTALPLFIQSRILSYLCPHEALRPRGSRWNPRFSLSFWDPPITMNLACAETLTLLLPAELLSVAQASPVLAAAVANLLASRVSYLTTCNTGDKLAEWVTTFAPYVKAVSTWDPLYEWSHERCFRRTFLLVFERQLQTSMRLFKALSVDAVKLEILDLTDVPFLFLEDLEDDLLGGLCTTLESNGATLRELALPVFRSGAFTEKALEMSTLKKLDVLTVKVWDSEKDWNSVPAGLRSHPFLRMIRAVDGHANRSRKLSTLSELRLMNVSYLPFENQITDSDRSAQVFNVIKTLRVGIYPSSHVDPDLNVPFLFLFKKLKRLFWNNIPDPNSSRFEELCTKLPEVHLCNDHWISSVRVGGEYHLRKESLCNALRRRYLKNTSVVKNPGSRRIRTVVAWEARRRDLRTVTRCCPNLEYLSLFAKAGLGNAVCLRELLRECKQMKGLELLLSYFDFLFYGSQGWHSLSSVIPKSHKSLCQLTIHMVYSRYPPVTCVEAAMDCFEEMIKAIGARARNVSFYVTFRPTKNAIILEGLCRLLKAVIRYTPALESLVLDFPIGERNSDDKAWNWDEGLVRRLFHLRNQLLRNVPSLRILDLGVWHGLSKPLHENHDMREMKPMRGDRESDDT